MRTEGQVPVRIGIGEFSIRHIMVVVDCDDEGILGVDVLTRGGARIDLAARTVSLEGLVVPLQPEGRGDCRQVSLAEGARWAQKFGQGQDCGPYQEGTLDGGTVGRDL